jgi:hypothetical protein
LGSNINVNKGIIRLLVLWMVVNVEGLMLFMVIITVREKRKDKRIMTNI